MDKWDVMQVILEFVCRNGEYRGVDTTAMLKHLNDAPELGIGQQRALESISWLNEHGYIKGKVSSSGVALFLKPTLKGDEQVLSGKSIRETLSSSLQPQAPSINNWINNSHVGQVAQGNANTLNQVNISAGDLSGLLEILREHGEEETADEAEQLAANGDTRGALRKVLEKVGDTTVQAGTTEGVKYLASLIPALVVLLRTATSL